MPRKVKTSIYVDKELWSRFKTYARRRGRDASNILEDLMMDELIEELLDEAVRARLGEPGEEVEIDFQPIEPLTGTVSELVREERRGRFARLSRQ